MTVRKPSVRRLAALALVAPSAALALAAGCVQGTDSDEDVGVVAQEINSTNPTCTKVINSDTTVHSIGWPFHEPGLCPATPEFTLAQATAACGGAPKYYSFQCTEFAAGDHTWTAYYACCGISGVGCSDGQREGFVDQTTYPNIASCAAGWSVPGVLSPNTDSATCGRNSGDDSTNPNGVGCSIQDACAFGWHVCTSAADVASRLPAGSTSCSTDAGTGFFTTRQSGPGCGVCATGTISGCNGSSCQIGCEQNQDTANDIFGCGTLGAAQLSSTCGVLDRFSQNLCGSLPSDWNCSAAAPAGITEAQVVVKTDSANGGVLCCRDLP